MRGSPAPAHAAALASSPRRAWTLARRIALLALAPTALVLAGGGLWLRTQMHDALYESFAHTLQAQQDRVAARLRPTGSGGVAEVAASGDAFNAIYSGWYWHISAGPAPDAPVLGRSRSLWDMPAIALLRPVGPARLGLLQGIGPMQEPLLGTQRPVILAGRDTPAYLTVLAPAQALQDNTQRIDKILLVSLAAFMAMLAATLLVQVRVGLAPLRRLTQAVAAQRQSGNPPQLDKLSAGADLAPLQRELTALLSRNERVVSRARAHAADLNHALKKPLALLAASASQQPTVAAPEVLRHITAMTRLIDRYQARALGDAMHAHTTGTTPAVTVHPCLNELMQAMRKLHANQQLHWQLALPPDASAWHWHGDRADLEEALGNLLDNAGKWAASHVRVSARAERMDYRDARVLCVCIEDDGPGMTEADRLAAGQRGLRFDESVPGTGLGLFIASQIAHAYDGGLRLDKSQALKGLRAELRLGGPFNA